MGLDLDGVKDEKEKQQEEEESEEQEVVEVESKEIETSESGTGIVKPVEDIDEVVKMYSQFEQIKQELLDSNKDLTKISGSVHVNKSGWRKIATAFNVTTDIVSKDIWEEDGLIHAQVESRATAPNGKSTSGIGMCSSNESNFMTPLGKHPEFSEPDDSDRIIRVDGKWRVLPMKSEVSRHNLVAIAETRSKNRAISDLVGGGEVSAEEMDAEFFLD